MFAVGARFQHLQKAVHDGGVLRGDVALAVNAGVEIEEIENGRLHGVDERLAVKAVFRIGDASFEQVEIAAADDLLLGREVHHGVEKQRQRTFHAVVALRRAQIYETGFRIDDLAPEIVRRFCFLDQFPLADDRQISGVQLEIPFVEAVAARAAQAEQMGQVFHLGIRRHDAQFVDNDYIFLIIHLVRSVSRRQK